MKKIFLLVIALCTIVSCAKEDSEQPIEEPKAVSFTAQMEEDATKTTISADGTIAWVGGEEIIVSDGKVSRTYIVTDTGSGNHRIATLSPKTGETPFTAAGTYTATYGNLDYQVYVSGTPGSNCTMSATAETTQTSETTLKCNFMFRNTCGVVEVTVGGVIENISKIAIGKYALYFTTPTTLNSSGRYLVAVSGGESFSKIKFVKSDGSRCVKNLTNPASVETNHKRMLKTGNYFVDGPYVKRTLSEAFTAGGDGHQVKFMTGNLYWDGSKYQVEPNQFYLATSWDPNHVSHLYNYKISAAASGYTPYESTLAYSAGNKANLPEECVFDNLADYPGYRLLTYAEIEYIRNKWTPSRTVPSPTHQIKKITVAGKDYEGVFLYPDNYTGTYNETNWEELDEAGVVFMQVSGYRSKQEFKMVTGATRYGYLTILCNGSTDMYNYGYINNTIYDQSNTLNLGAGFIRLVKDVNTGVGNTQDYSEEEL